jgi:GNAT superfamily N-acetyltransferase
MNEFDLHRGPRAELLPFFRMADDSESEIQGYFQLGDVLVARDKGQIIGMAQVEQDGDTVQIISLAVAPLHRGTGIGSKLIDAAMAYCKAGGTPRLIVCTGAWEADTIQFYINRGFRLFHVEPNFFTPAKGYPQNADQVQFELVIPVLGPKIVPGAMEN